MEDNKSLLEDVQNELIEWRGSPPRRGPIPKRFWDKVFRLLRKIKRQPEKGSFRSSLRHSSAKPSIPLRKSIID